MMKHLLPLFLLVPALCFGQAFGFEDDSDEGGSSLPFNFEFGGKIEVGPTLFINDFKGDGDAESLSALDFVEAYASFDISGKNAQAFVGLNLSYASFSELKDGDFTLYPPALIDELWLRGYFDRFSVQAGFIKLRWGRMYSPGPLDIVNPLDYSDLTNLTESRDMKIARPMVHASYKVGDFSSFEAVFLPNFAGHKFAQDGRWIPDEYANVTSVYAGGILNRALQKYPTYSSIISSVLSGMLGSFSSAYPEFPDTSTPDYFQAGMRFNTVVGSVDLGFQYFYGNYLRPSVSLNGVDNFIDDLASQLPSYPSMIPHFDLLSAHIEYTRYHQIGVDYSQVLAGFTLRAEFAVHITSDFSGDDGNVKNPFLAWSFGFDRDIFAGININIQCNETIRLFDDKVGENPAMDCEAETNAVATRLILQISKNFFRDRLECKVVGIWDIEDSGGVFIPSVAWSINDIRMELSAGFFAGDENSELGQYRDNSYVKLKLTYSF
jgi:hypothetical protein